MGKFATSFLAGVQYDVDTTCACQGPGFQFLHEAE